MSRTNALVTCSGRRSGRSFTLPLRYAQVGSGLWIYPARPDRKTWWRNLEGGVPVTVRLRGLDVPAWAEAIQGNGPRVAEGLWAYYRRFPMLAKSMGLSWDPSSVDRAAARKKLLPLLILASTLASTPGRAQATTAPPGSPNIVIIMTDDQRWDTATSQYMPNLTSILGSNPSITYPNAFIPNSLCCPSRTSTLTGDYSHTTGVFGNGGAMGGFPSFTLPPVGFSTAAANESTTIATDLHSAGYRTGLVGKYLNEYPAGHYDYVPPGWDSWFSIATGTYYDYYAAVNGHRSRRYGSRPADYSSRVLGDRATGFIANSGANPFFLYLAFTAPHSPAIPAPRDVDRFGVARYPQPPTFGKAYPSDPTYIKNRAWDRTKAQSTNAFHRDQVNSIYGVDTQIGRVWNALPDNTIVLFMSDNGYLWGEHRWVGKIVPYNESLRIPMAVAVKAPTSPRWAAGSVDPRIVLNVDVLPTLEAYAGFAPANPFEGIDAFGPVVRDDFVLEHWREGGKLWDGAMPTYCGVRSVDWMYTKYRGGQEQLYDELADPYEVNNLAVTDPANPKLQAMRNRAAVLCVGGALYPSDWPIFP